MPKGSGGMYTSGGSLSNLAAHRHRARRAAGRGLRGRHDLLLRGDARLRREGGARRRVPARGLCASSPSTRGGGSCRRARQRRSTRTARRGCRPFLVVANAGTTNTGAIDPLARDAGGRPRARPVGARRRRVRRVLPHGRGRRGAPAAASATRDSLTLDPHKGLFLPYGTGVLLVQDPAALRRGAPREPPRYLQDVERRDVARHSPTSRPSCRATSAGCASGCRSCCTASPRSAPSSPRSSRCARHAYDAARAASRCFEMLRRAAALGRRLHGAAAAGQRLRRERVRRRAAAPRQRAPARVPELSTTIDGRYVARLCVLRFRTHEDRVDEAVDALIEEARAI